MSLLQQLVKEVEVYDSEGREYQLTDVKVEDNCITARTKINLILSEFEFEGRVIEEIDTTLHFRIKINSYDDDLPFNERVEIRDVEHFLEESIVDGISENIYGAHRLSERVFEFLSNHGNVADVYAYVTFASLD